jgi:hypothetical protein
MYATLPPGTRRPYTPGRKYLLWPMKHLFDELPQYIKSHSYSILLFLPINHVFQSAVHPFCRSFLPSAHPSIFSSNKPVRLSTTFSSHLPAPSKALSCPSLIHVTAFPGMICRIWYRINHNHVVFLIRVHRKYTIHSVQQHKLSIAKVHSNQKGDR